MQSVLRPGYVVRTRRSEGVSTMTRLSRVPDPRTDSTSGLPDADELAGELRRLREKGLLKARELRLPALDEVSRIIDDAHRPGPRRLEAVLRKALERMGSEEFGLAAGTLFGLTQGSIGTRPTDLRERAANVFGLSAETFRKDRERQILARLAEELLILAEAEAEAGAEIEGEAGARVGRLDGPQPGSALVSVDATAAFGPTGGIAGLPRENSVFVGRHAELAALTEALTRTGRPSVCAQAVVHGPERSAGAASFFCLPAEDTRPPAYRFYFILLRPSPLCKPYSPFFA